MGMINCDVWHLYVWDTVAAILTGGVYPAFGIVFGRAVDTFSLPNPHERRVQGDRNALYFFIISIVSTVTIGIQNYNYLFGATAGALTSKLHSIIIIIAPRERLVRV